MEKKKLLLVAVSVGVVMLIIIGIPLLLISPRPGHPVQVVKPAEIVSGQIEATEPPQLTQAPAELPVPEAAPPVTPPEEAPVVKTIDIPVPHTVAVPSAPIVSTTRPAAVKTAAKPAAKPAAEKPVQVAKDTPKPPAPKKPAEETGKNNWWVQAGAFSTNERAEGVKETLESKSLSSIIDINNINGKTWYRVRVGPYISENEAIWWLGLVKANGFDDSLVMRTPAVQ